jgi:hypothetical protein
MAVAVASSGIASTLMSGGRTAHATLQLPFNLAHLEIATCNITKGTGRALVLRDCKILLLDECTMAHKNAFEALDKTLQDIQNSKQIMDGLVVLLVGDFRQNLPVMQRGTQADELNSCLKALSLGMQVKRISADYQH